MNKDNHIKDKNECQEKTCTVCGEVKPATTKFWSKMSAGKFGLSSQCKVCNKAYRKANKKQMKAYREANKKQMKAYREANKEHYKAYREANKEQRKAYREANKEKIKEQEKAYYKAPLQYNSKIVKSLSFCETFRDNNGLAEVQCTYCGKWHNPTNLQAKNRWRAVNGKMSAGTECRFYCDNPFCKEACTIFKVVINPKSPVLESTTEAHPVAKKIAMEREDYQCERCGIDSDHAILEAHHELPKRWYP